MYRFSGEREPFQVIRESLPGFHFGSRGLMLPEEQAADRGYPAKGICCRIQTTSDSKPSPTTWTAILRLPLVKPYVTLLPLALEP